MLGVFDSGMGGLTFVKEVKKWLPDLPVVYFGDTARCPWGNKSPDLVKKYTDEITSFLIGQGIQEIVIACNTASALAGDYLQEKYSAITFYNVIDPVVRKIGKEIRSHEKDGNFSIGIIGTEGTIENGIYEKKIKELNPKIKIYSQACPLLVPLVEENMLDHPATRMIVEEYLKDFKNKKIKILILGCTHYPLVKDLMQNFLGDVKIIDSAEEMAKKIVRQRRFKTEEKKSDVYYFSDLSDSSKKMAAKVLGQKVVLRKMIF